MVWSQLQSGALATNRNCVLLHSATLCRNIVCQSWSRSNGVLKHNPQKHCVRGSDFHKDFHAVIVVKYNFHNAMLSQTVHSVANWFGTTLCFFFVIRRNVLLTFVVYSILCCTTNVVAMSISAPLFTKSAILSRKIELFTQIPWALDVMGITAAILCNF